MFCYGAVSALYEYLLLWCALFVGKTSTVVEAIKQVGKLRPSEKLLICAPSNTAADLLLRRLADSLPASELFRFNSYQRDRATVDAVAFTRSLYDDGVRAFTMPPLEQFLKYKYIVCTCTMAGKLSNYGVPRGKRLCAHHSHVVSEVS
jgi:helicase MOV-10